MCAGRLKEWQGAGFNSYSLLWIARLLPLQFPSLFIFPLSSIKLREYSPLNKTKALLAVFVMNEPNNHRIDMLCSLAIPDLTEPELAVQTSESSYLIEKPKNA